MSLLGEQWLFVIFCIPSTSGPHILSTYIERYTRVCTHTYAYTHKPASDSALMIAYLSEWMRQLQYNAWFLNCLSIIISIIGRMKRNQRTGICFLKDLIQNPQIWLKVVYLLCTTVLYTAFHLFFLLTLIIFSGILKICDIDLLNSTSLPQVSWIILYLSLGLKKTWKGNK